MPARVRLLFRYAGRSRPTPGDFAALLDDIEAAYRLAFWTNRLGGFLMDEEVFPEGFDAAGLRQDYAGAVPAPWVPLPPPPTRTELELQTDELTFESPFEFLGTIEGIAGLGSLGGILWFFARNLEDLFDMRDRIRLRRIRRERQMYEEALERDEARRAYLHARRQRPRRFELEEGQFDDGE